MGPPGGVTAREVLQPQPQIVQERVGAQNGDVDRQSGGLEIMNGRAKFPYRQLLISQRRPVA